jgi:hypothetical protein
VRRRRREKVGKGEEVRKEEKGPGVKIRTEEGRKNMCMGEWVGEGEKAMRSCI